MGKSSYVKGFTLIEVLLVVVIIAVLSGIVIVAINPAQQITKANNARRMSDTRTINNAIQQYTINNRGNLPGGIGEEVKMLGTEDSGCQVSCQEHTTEAACLDLSNDLIPEYIADIPIDPKGSEEKTYYAVLSTSAGRIQVVSCLLEGEEAEEVLAFSCGSDFTDDREGGITYGTVEINNQCWMAENLKYLPAVSGTSTNSTTEPHYYVYDYNGTDVEAAKSEANYGTYGVLYNWPAAMAGESSSTLNPSGVQGVCPAGWHLPSPAEWDQLTDYLVANSGYWCGENSSNIAKALASTSEWNTHSTDCRVGNDQASNNASGFTALPAGYFAVTNFAGISALAGFWSSEEGTSTHSTYRFFFNSNVNVLGAGIFKERGYSVRCIKDEE